jgi:hypothetical protein
MSKKQNFFADVEDALDEKGGLDSVFFLAGVSLLIVLWIHFETFWGALIFVAIGGTTICGLAALFIFSVSLMLAKKEGEAWPDRVFRFFLGLLPAVFSGATLYFFFLICQY